MAHWDILDTSHGNVTISIDAVYGQQTIDDSGRTDMIYIRVSHIPQGVSEATGYSVNITSGPTWSMNRIFLNATLKISLGPTAAPAIHPIAIEWLTSSPQTYNIFSWKKWQFIKCKWALEWWNWKLNKCDNNNRRGWTTPR